MNRNRKTFSLLLVLVFFSSQAFSCCLVNHKMGHFVRSWFTEHSALNASELTHSCCPSHATQSTPNDKASAQATGCCIQDANLKVPQLASEPMTPPILYSHIVSINAIPSVESYELPSLINTHYSSDSPLYLTSLRLLI